MLENYYYYPTWILTFFSETKSMALCMLPQSWLVNSLRPRDTYICISKLTIIGSDNGLSPDRRQAIIWTNAGLLLIGPLRTNFSEILIEILTFSFKKMRLKVSSAKRRPFCLGLNVLRPCPYGDDAYIAWLTPLKTNMVHQSLGNQWCLIKLYVCQVMAEEKLVITLMSELQDRHQNLSNNVISLLYILVWK